MSFVEPSKTTIIGNPAEGIVEDVAGWAVPPSSWMDIELRSARLMTLARQPLAAEAIRFSAEITERILHWEMETAARGNRRSEAEAARFRAAVGAILGDILSAWSRDCPEPSSHRLKAQTFTGEAISYRNFTAATKAMVALQLLHFKEGTQTEELFPGVFRGWASRWWPSAALLGIAGRCGLSPGTAALAYQIRPSATAPVVREPLILRPLVLAAPRSRAS